MNHRKTDGRGAVAGYVVGILIASIIVFIIVRYLILLRRWITEDKLGLTGKLSSRSTTPATRDEEEMAEMSKSTVQADVVK